MWVSHTLRCSVNLICKVWRLGGNRLGIFHISCLEDILDLSSPTILPHISFSGIGSRNYWLDIGAHAIAQAWYRKCEMDNMITTDIDVTTNTLSEVVATPEKDIPSTEPVTATSSSASAPAPSTSTQFQWEGKNLIYLPDLNKKGSTEDTSHSWYHDREALFVPWSEDIITDKLPRLPSNGGFILEDDAIEYLKKKPLRTSDGNLWSILSYLPHEPSQWREKHALSESLEKWYQDRVRSQL